MDDRWSHKYRVKDEQTDNGGCRGADLQWAAVAMWKTNMWSGAQQPGIKAEAWVACKVGCVAVHHRDTVGQDSKCPPLCNQRPCVLYACPGITFDGTRCWKRHVHEDSGDFRFTRVIELHQSLHVYTDSGSFVQYWFKIQSREKCCHLRRQNYLGDNKVVNICTKCL